MTTVGNGSLLDGGLYPLPENWKWMILSDIGDIVAGGTPSTSDPKNFDGDIPWITPADLSGFSEKLIRSGRRNISASGLKSSSASILPTGSVLFSSRAPIGYVAIAANPLSTNQGFKNIIPNDNVTSDYLYHYLRICKELAESRASGTTFLEISKSKFSLLPIPIAPQDEQRCIVAKLESILAQIQTARAALNRILGLIKTFRQSVLAAAFRGELTERDPKDEPAEILLERIRTERRRRWAENLRAKGKDPANYIYEEPDEPDTSNLPELPKGWVWKTVGSVFDVSLGGTPRRDKTEYWNGEIPWVSSGEVAFSHIKRTKETITDLGLSHSNAKYNPAGSVLLAMIGEGKTRGQAAILDITATTNQNIAAISCAATPIKSEWLFYWFMYQYEEVRGGGLGGAQPALNAGRIKELVFSISPIEEQERIIKKLKVLFGQIETVETTMQIASRRLDELEQAALSKAFRGELT